MSEYTNNLNVVSTYKGEKSVSITGTFQCGIHFPKSGAKPFKVIERTSKNNKQYKQIACTVVISPDDRKNNNGNPFSSVYYDGKYLTFKEFLETTGVELIKGKLYAGVFMDRSTMGLYHRRQRQLHEGRRRAAQERGKQGNDGLRCHRRASP